MNTTTPTTSTLDVPPPEVAAPPEPTPKQRRNGRIKFFIKLIVSACLLTWVITHAKISEVTEAMGGVNWPLLASAYVLLFVGTMITAIRWGGLLKAQGAPFPVSTLAKTCMVAGFLRQFLPSTIGGDGVRVYDTMRYGAPKGVAVTALLTDRFVGLLALILFAAGALAMNSEMATRYPSLLKFVVIGTASLVAINALVFFPPRQLVKDVRAGVEKLPGPLRKFALKIGYASKAYHGKGGAFAVSFFWSLLLQVNVVAFYFIIAKAMGLDVSFSNFFLIVPVALFVMMIPTSINGIGLREGAFVFLLGVYGVEPGQALAFAWLEYGLFLTYSLVGGLIYATRKK